MMKPGQRPNDDTRPPWCRMTRARPGLCVLLAALVLATGSCQRPENIEGSTSSSISIAVAPEASVVETSPQDNLDAGAYLVAHIASYDLDLPQAAERYTAALAKDPSNLTLLERSFRMLYINGQIENAAAIASRIEQISRPLELGGEPAAAIAARNEDWEGLDVLADHLWADRASQPLGIVLGAWALAFRDQGDAGLSQLLDLATLEHHGADIILKSQSALMAEYLKRPDDALAFARDVLKTEGAPVASRILMAGILARGGAGQEALRRLDPSLGPLFDKPRLRRDIESGALSLFPPPTRNQLLANAVIEASQLDDSKQIHPLARLHLASYLDADYGRLIYMLGQELFQLGYPEEAQQQLSRMPQTSIWLQPGLILTARHLSRQPGGTEGAAQIYTQLLSNDAENVSLWQQSADNDRWGGRYEMALPKYDTALDLDPTNGRLHYYRGICLDRLGRETEAEVAFRKAVSLDPNDAYALNYFGYWLLEQDKAPVEALGMIRKAVEKQPQNGYFVDSLGWGYFKLGQYDKAVLYLERAVTIQPVDPVITDHLGDAYAKLGRLREARFHWERALIYANEDTDIETIRHKIRAETPPEQP
ncbi:tetratricopeptide repeat protein [Alphaproteobacteria bacterium LSUCC0684]